jgi:hypothetical protein
MRLPSALPRECIEVFGCGLVQMRGMTDTAGAIVAPPRNAAGKILRRELRKQHSKPE